MNQEFALLLSKIRYIKLIGIKKFLHESEAGFIRITKKTIISYLIVFFVFSGTGLFFLFNPFGTKSADAAWFNDNWGYRKRIDLTVASSASDITNLDTQITVDTTGITSNLQSNCEDLRFTSVTGTILPHYIDTCTDNSATNKIWVRADLVPKNTTTYTLYMYYGNASAGSANNPGLATLYANLEAYWTFNEASWGAPNCSSGVVSDTSVNAISGKACPNSTGPTGGATGKYGNAVDFDGGDNLDFDQPAALNANTAITVSAWVNPDANSLTSGYYDILSDYDGGGTTAHYEFTFLNGNLEYNYGSSSSYVTYTPTVAISFSAGTWHHVVFTHSGSNTDGYFYVDGIKYNSTRSGSVDIPTSVFGDTGVGSGTINDPSFEGLIDDLRIYHRNFSDNDVAYLYSNPGSVTTTAVTTSKPTTNFASEEKGTAPIAYWKFDDGQGTTAQDSGSNNKDGTLVGTPDWKAEEFCIAGKCLYFNGADPDKVYSTDSLPTGDFTYSIWIKPTNLSDNHQIFNAENVAASGDNDEFSIWSGANNGTINLFLNGSNALSTDSNAIVTNTWQFITVTRSGGNLTIYVNGAQKANNPSGDSTALSFAVGCNLYIGIDATNGCDESGGTFGSPFYGFMDEPKVYNFALTAGQIQANYNARSNNEGLSAQLGGPQTGNTPGSLSNGLVGYWKLDESATPSLDLSGNGNSGTWNGNTAATTGKFGNSAGFDGTGDYINIPNNSVLDLQQEITLSAWIKRSATDNYGGIIAKTNGSNRWDYDLHICDTTNCGAANTDKIAFFSDNLGTNNFFNNSAITDTTTWHHIVVTKSTTKINFYLDGTLKDSVNNTLSMNNNADPVRIGTDGPTWGADADFSGSIDEARVYNRALSSTEVSQLYNWAPGPSIFLKMDDNTGTSLNDSSGNAKTGTLGSSTAAPAWTGGKFGGALAFDGTNDYANVATPGLPTTDFTYQAWVYRNEIGNGGLVFSAEDDSGDNDEIHIGISSSNTLDVRMDNALRVTGVATIGANSWNHLTVTRSGSAITTYINGIKDSTATYGTASNFSNCRLYIGIDPQTVCDDTTGVSTVFGSPLNARIDDVKVYNYSRSSSQIIEDMNAGHPAPGSPVGSAAGYWKFDQGADNMCSGGTNDACNSGSLASALDGAKTNMAASWPQNGKFGKALDFDGSDDYVLLTDNTSFDMVTTSNYTWSFWINPDDFEAWNTVWGSSSGTTNHFNIYAHTVSGQTPVWNDITAGIQVGWNSTDTTDYLVSQSIDNVLATGTWAHVTVTYDGSVALASRFKIYINGADKTTTGTSGGTLGNISPNSTRIGGDEPVFTGENFDGKADEIKFYTSTLNAEQVKAEFNRGSSQVLGALSTAAAGREANAAASEYCIPGDSTTCTAPVARWDFENQSGNDHFDTSGNANNCSDSSGKSLVNGKIGMATDVVDSVGGSMFCGSGSTLDDLPDNGMTLEGWIYPRNEGEFGQGMIALKSDYNSTGWELRLGGNTTDGIQFLSDYTGTDFLRISADSVITYNAWNHIAFTWTGSATATTAKIYINGRETTYASPTDGTGSRVSDAAQDWIFGDDGGGTSTFDGKIDQFRAFNYVRTPAQIAWDYNRGKPLGHWRMDECQGTTINDSSGNGYPGTLVVGGSGTFTSPGTCSASSASTSWYNGATGKRNASMIFDDTDDRIYVPNALPTTDFTLSAWIYKTSTQAFRIVFAAESSAASGDNDELFFGFQNGVQFLAYVGNSSNMTQGLDYEVPLNTWTHVAATRSGSTVNVYVNGLVAGTGSDSGDYTFDSGCNLYIGADPTNGCDESGGTFSGSFNGNIDDARVYSYALTAEQLKTVINDGALRFGPTTGSP